MGLTPAERAGLARVLADPTWEVIPLRRAREEVAHLPEHATVSVTASPAKGLDATIDLAIELERSGYRAVPHLAARMVRDEQHLRELLAKLADAGIDRAFVVGGDELGPGAFPDALSLLTAMAELGQLPRDIGIAAYPQGHPVIPEERLMAALAAKASLARSMTTQLCFDSRALASWLAARRRDGVSLPVRLGIPGVADIPRLLAISARIGVRDAGRFVRKNRGIVGQLLRSAGRYRPTALIEGLAPVIADPVAEVIGLHVYTFNNVGPTVAWWRAELDRLTAGTDPPR
jgi:methylenetetrahydrofolate reductase (NADPH)